MHKIVLLSSLVLLGLVSPPASRAQNPPKPDEPAKAIEPAPSFYHLVFVVQELSPENKPVNTRSYTTTVSTDRHFNGQIRTGSRIPIATGSYAGGEGKPSVNTQWQYIDAGTNFDMMNVKEIGHQLSLDLSTEISSMADHRDPNLNQPVIRQNRWHAAILIPIGKPTVVFSSDSLDSNGSMQVVVTATPLQ